MTIKNAFRFIDAYPLVLEISLKHFIGKLAKNFFATYGAIWVILEPITYFLSTNASIKFKQYWYWYLLFAVIVTIAQTWPKHIHRFKLNNRDVSVELIIGNIWNRKGTIIVPINNKLAITNKVMTSTSILKQMIARNYNSNPNSLQHVINGATQDDYYTNRLANGDYQMGTTVPVSSGERDFYLVCNTVLNSQQRSQTTKDQLNLCLNEFWTFLSMNGSKDELLMPLLGTGRGRINISREEVYKDIVLSFIASCANSTYCDKLRICVSTADVRKNKIKIDELVAFTKAKVEFADFDNNVTPAGTNQIPFVNIPVAAQA